MQFTGLLYAPNGKVVINGTSIHINGSVIAKETELYVNTMQILTTKETESFYQFLSLYENDEIITVGGAIKEDNSILLNLESNVNLETIDIYVRSDKESQFHYLETITDYEHELKNIPFEETLDITVIGYTPYGDKADATILTVGYDNEEMIQGNDGQEQTQEGNGKQKELCTLKQDSDRDGIADGVEIWYLQTNPNEKDTDHDGFDDYTEVFYLYTNPNAYTADEDFDGDGLTNKQELAKKTNPYLKDSDFDGMLDSEDDRPWRYNEPENITNNNITGNTITDSTKSNYEKVDYSEKRKTGVLDRQVLYADTNGNIRQYAYNFINDHVQYVTENGKTTKYYYDLEENLTFIVEENREASYAVTYYQDGDNAGVSHNGMNYDIVNKKASCIQGEAEGKFYDEACGEETTDIYIAQKLYKQSISKQKQHWEQYGNKDTFVYYYNHEGSLEKICENDKTIFTYKVENEKLQSIYDCVKDITYTYHYDNEQNLKQITDTLGNKMEYKYDEEYYKITYNINGEKLTHTIYYNAKEENAEGCSAELITGAVQNLYQNNDNQKTKCIQQKNGIKIKSVYTISNEDIASITYENGDTENYTYTKDNKLSEVYYNDHLKAQYKYDKKGQLIEECNVQKNQGCRYIYDTYGNITAREYYEYDTKNLLSQQSFTYNKAWSDQIKTIDGEEIFYDHAGNPVTYTKGMKLKWTGRRLDQIQTTDKNITYTYNEEGIRNSKTINGTTTNYVIEGQDIIYEKTGENETWYIYDADTKVTGLIYNGKTYYYEKNAQNDVVALLNENGERVCSYTYDAWGNLMSTEGNVTIAQANKYRYRSYYYDEETGFYYLTSRYYDFAVGRFINADCLESIYQDFDNLNLYLYCNNDPVNQIDPSGKAPIYLKLFYSSDIQNDNPGLTLSCRTTCAIWIQQMKQGGNVKNYLVSSKKDFIKKWNEMTSATFVAIFSHGSPQSIQFGSDSVKASDLNKELKTKSVKVLWLMGCNTGHFAYKDNNVASVMAKKINGVVVAPDGTAYCTITVNDIYRKKHFGVGVTGTDAENEWQKWNNKGKACYKTYQGWLIYQKKNGSVHLTITGMNNVISIFSLSSFLVGHKYFSYK